MDVQIGVYPQERMVRGAFQIEFLVKTAVVQDSGGISEIGSGDLPGR